MTKAGASLAVQNCDVKLLGERVLANEVSLNILLDMLFKNL